MSARCVDDDARRARELPAMAENEDRQTAAALRRLPRRFHYFSPDHAEK
jgi:hypothetical protein